MTELLFSVKLSLYGGGKKAIYNTEFITTEQTKKTINCHRKYALCFTKYIYQLSINTIKRTRYTFLKIQFRPLS